MTDPSPELSLKELTGLAPILVPAFAFAFVVGYFSGIDISWLSFFSLKDHALIRASRTSSRNHGQFILCIWTELNASIETIFMDL